MKTIEKNKESMKNYILKINTVLIADPFKKKTQIDASLSIEKIMDMTMENAKDVRIEIYRLWSSSKRLKLNKILALKCSLKKIKILKKSHKVLSQCFYLIIRITLQRLKN